LKGTKRTHPGHLGVLLCLEPYGGDPNRINPRYDDDDEKGDQNYGATWTGTGCASAREERGAGNICTTVLTTNAENQHYMPLCTGQAAQA